MGDFYSEWLRASARIEAAVGSSPVVARGRDLVWITTPQDHRVAMLIGGAAGFATQGTALLTAEIPPGSRTGRHVHGEEAIHIVSGTGYSVIGDARYDWKAGTTLHVPYRAEHQHVNTADTPAVYVSAVTQDLDFAVNIGRLEQLEEKGAGHADLDARHPTETSQFAADGRRIALHLEDAIDEKARRLAGHAHHKPGKGAHRHAGIWILMGGSESPSDETNGFRAKAAAMTNIFEEAPHSGSHKHTHTEAMLYVLEGRGYSIVDGERYDWEAGDAVHVPPRMTTHEHFNDSDARTRTLRIEFGIRFFYEALWTGYEKVQDRLEATAR
ncbi:MAG TPA: cupin domain-containing protein [Candidatus Limnocylindria bacterium]|nr:cupin domain-containing protein [Candidatus Limnocylindria bacterium]